MNEPPHPLDAAGIAARVPHHGRMCLLEAMHACSPEHIHCSTTGHTAADHPLRVNGRLPAAAAIELASQAMALHGVLNDAAAAGSPPRAGYIASARAVVLHVERLCNQPGPLRVEAWRQAGDATQALYRFAVANGHGQPLAEGRLSVVLDADLWKKLA